MATATANYGFLKPDPSENVNVVSQLNDNLDDIDTELKRVDDVAAAVAGGVWASYAVTWSSTGTPPALGNGTLVGVFAKTGKIYHVDIRLVIGTTTTLGTGDWTFTLPVTAETRANLETFGHCVSLVDGSYRHDVVNVASGATTMRMIGIAAGAFYDLDTPGAWSNTEFLNISLRYRAA